MPRIAYFFFISTSQKTPQQYIQLLIGVITVTGTSTTFAHSNVFTDCLAASTMPRQQSVASMIILANLNPSD